MRWKNIKKWIGEAHRGSVMVDKETKEIRRMGRPPKQNEDRVNLRKVENGIGKVGGGRGRRMTGSLNVDECRGRLEKIEDCVVEGRKKLRKVNKGFEKVNIIEE
jgi:hypothetical protein